MRFITMLFVVLAACTVARVPVAGPSDPQFTLKSSLLSQYQAPTNEDEMLTEEPVASFFSDDPMLEVREFDMPTAKGLIKKAQELDTKGHRQIYIKINSYGGSIHWGMEIIQALEGLKTPVTCVVDWKAYSMGAFLLESDACDKRLMTKRSTLLFHEPLVTETGGNAHELRNTAERLETLGKALMASTAERLKISEAELAEKTRAKDWTLAYDDAKKFGAVDGIVSAKDLPPLTPYEMPSLLQLLLGG